MNTGCNDCNDPCNKRTPCRNDDCNCIVRFPGPPVDCLGIDTGDTFETVIEKVAGFVCDLQFEDGAPGEPGPAGADGADGIPGQDGENANSYYGNTLFVDQIYGNDATGTRERFDLPYRNIQTAINSAQALDTVHVRTGTYTEAVKLKDLVGLSFEKVTLLGNISDNAIVVRTKIIGDLTIKHNSNHALELTGVGSRVVADISEIDSTGTNVIVSCLGSKNCTELILDIDRIIGLERNYVITMRGNSNCRINVKDLIATASTTAEASGISIFHFSESYVGHTFIKCPLVIVGESLNEDGGVLYREFVNEENNQAYGNIFIDLGIVRSAYSKIDVETGRPLANLGFVNKNSGNNLTLKVGEMYPGARDGIHVKTNISSEERIGVVKFEGTIFAKASSAIRYASNTIFIVKDSRFLVEGTAQSFEQPAIILGNPVGLSYIGGSFIGYKFTVEDSVIRHSTFNGPAITKMGTGYFGLINVDIECGTISGWNCVSTDGGINSDVYFKNTTSNVNISATVNDISTGGFTLDPAMRVII